MQVLSTEQRREKVAEYLTEYPDTPTLTLAKLIYKNHSKSFASLDAARSGEHAAVVAAVGCVAAVVVIATGCSDECECEHDCEQPHQCGVSQGSSPSVVLLDRSQGVRDLHTQVTSPRTSAGGKLTDQLVRC